MTLPTPSASLLALSYLLSWHPAHPAYLPFLTLTGPSSSAIPPVRSSLGHCLSPEASATAQCQLFSLSTAPPPPGPVRQVVAFELGARGGGGGDVLSRRARQLTQNEAEHNEPRARHRREAEAHHDPEEQAATRAAPPRKRLGEAEEDNCCPPTTALKAGTESFSAGHKTRGGALSCIQPISALQSSEKGSDVGRVGGTTTPWLFGSRSFLRS